MKLINANLYRTIRKALYSQLFFHHYFHLVYIQMRLSYHNKIRLHVNLKDCMQQARAKIIFFGLRCSSCISTLGLSIYGRHLSNRSTSACTDFYCTLYISHLILFHCITMPRCLYTTHRFHKPPNALRRFLCE